MKKNMKTVLVFGLMIVLGLGYYYYISNRTSTSDSTEKAITDQEISALSTIDIKGNYPESPREVMKLYARITKAYYRTGISVDNIEALGKQARLLFDNELKSKQTESEFLVALKADIKNYNELKRYISDFSIMSAADIKYTTIATNNYAIGTVLYYVREGNKLSSIYHSYKFRKDGSGKWKILYWEISSPVIIKED